MGSALSLMTTSLRSPTARKLMAELDAELTALYPDHPYPPPFGDDEAKGVGSVLIAYQESKAVGCGAVRRLDDTTAELMRMYVMPSARGRSIGSALLQALEAEAAAMGATKVLLETGDRQPDALALYTRAGYVPTETWMDDPNPHSIFMERGL